MSTPPTILAFTHFDPTGAAGALGDALTCASMGCHLACATTLLLVQDGDRTEAETVVDPDWLEQQARAILQDMPVAAFKVGATGSADLVRVIAEIVSDYPDVPLVLHPWLSPDAEDGEEQTLQLEAARELLLPQTTLVSVGLAAARRWLAAADEAAETWPAAECARRLLEWGAENVLITRAAHVGDHVVNALFRAGEQAQQESLERIDLTFRGAGDTLSTAIAALLAQGLHPADAVREANDYLGQALAGGFRIGMGAAMPDRLFWASDDEDAAAEKDDDGVDR